jgi:glutamate/tyrosine decarboxylase-like PLP-dependent enzyme
MRGARDAPAPICDVHVEIDAHWPYIQNILHDLRRVSDPGVDEPISKGTNNDDWEELTSLAIPQTTAQPLTKVVQEAYHIFDHRMRTNHPTFFSFIPSNSTELSWLGDILVSAFNAHTGGRIASAGPCGVETALVGWLASKINFPSTAGGLFVSGGSMANLMAMTIARDQVLPRGAHSRGVIYVGDQVHYSISKAARVLGFGEDQVRQVKCNASFQTMPQDLQRQIRRDKQTGLIPFLVVATFGCTETGAIDPIDEISKIVSGEGLWLHVDGAFGASVALSSSRQEVASVLGLAHSVSWDAHKWLFQTYGCGMLLVHDKNKLVSSFHSKADIIDREGRLEPDIGEFWDFGIELTRPSRAMRLWFTFRVLGEERIGTWIDHGPDLTETIQSCLEERPCWEIVSRASLGILNFRYNPGGMTEEALAKVNEQIRQAMLASNTAAFMTTKLQGKVALRICCITTHLAREHAVNLVRVLDQTARAEYERQQHPSRRPSAALRR